METICAAAAEEGDRDRSARDSTLGLFSDEMSASVQHAQGTDNSSLVTLDFGPEEEIRAERPASKGRLSRTLKKKPGRNEKKRGQQYSPRKRDEGAEAQSSIGHLVLAAELMEKASECQDLGDINQSILHDHGEYCVPNDPELLMEMVRELKRTTHQQSQLLLSTQEKLDCKEKHCQELQEKWDNERWMLLTDMGQQITQLESDVRNLHCEKEILEKKNNELQEQLARSSRTVLYLSQQVKSKETDRNETSFCLKSIKNESKWVRFYTGFDGYEQLSNFLAFLTADPDLCTGKIRRRTEVGPQNALGLEDQLFLVLTRLRLGLLLQDLAFRFRVSESTVSRYWLNWTELLHARLTQVPVLYSTRYLDLFEPKRLEQYEGLTCTVMDCTDLFFEVQAKDRSKPASNHPRRNHYLRRGYAIASSNGFMTFSSSLPFGIATKIMDSQPQEEIRGGITSPLQFPPFMQNDPVQLTQEQHGMSRQVLSLLSLTDKALNFRFLKGVYPPNMEAQVDRAWIICCYLACLLHEPMGLS
ncbi:uncharacterized protein LOC108696677 [Xenopus laevis]|uniref:Uncharacterized protein LOC108696677 n=2 Tax=Xenopus laevis TaxID=8355 RepID=A0A1L8FMW7_XENLA|nr:uncharacterized protein LOC108696677 [Xenopus laevis]OCT72944.1 hypothetical protein XELAEV_18035925mg [Xenopus laevis]